MGELSRAHSSTLTRSESIAAALVAMPAAIVVAAYLIDRAGGSFTPPLMVPITLAGGVIALFGLGRRADWDRADVATAVAIVTLTFAWLMWIARPSFLPLGSGPDLTHHLLLIQYIERHWRLVHGPGVEDYLGEMVYYTPGSHILTALAGAWTRTTGFHALHGVMAATVALKAGFVYLIAMRILPRGLPRVPIAAIAALALFSSQTYFLGSFADFSFLAQVVAEMFAVATWWALTAWDQRPDRRLMVFAGLTGSALFLTWPVLIGPPLVVLGALVLLPHSLRFSTRVVHAAIAAAPILIVAGLFIAGRTGMLLIAGTGGRAVWPTVGAYGWWFVVLSTAGLLIAALSMADLKVRTARSPRTAPSPRTLALFALAIGLQATALYGLARRNGNEPYMALKMFYLLLCPQAIAVALAIGEVWVRLKPRSARLKPNTTYESVRRQPDTTYAWLLAAVVAFFVFRPLLGAPKSLIVAQHPATSLELEQAGNWARAHAPFKCVEYLVGDDETAYWLHLAVLGNARQGLRTGDNATYELTPALVRWLTPGGLPYAIVDRRAVPTDIRNELDIVAQFGDAAVAKRRGSSACDER